MFSTRVAVPTTIVLCLVVTGVAVFGSVTAGATSADAIHPQYDSTDPIVAVNQSVPESAEAGETVSIELSINLSEPAEQRVDVTTEFGPAVNDIEVIDDDGATIAEPTSSNDVLAASYGSVESVTLQYEIVVPANTSDGDEFNISTTVSIDETYERTPDNTLTIVDETIESADRSAPAGAKPGESITVSTNVTLDSTVTDLNITETIEPAAEQTSLIDSDGATLATATPDKIAASWGNTDAVTLTYEVTLPEENVSEGDVYTINGTVTTGDATATINSSRIRISDVPGAVQYADEETGQVTNDGLFTAAADFRDGNAGPQALLDTAAAFRSGSSVF